MDTTTQDPWMPSDDEWRSLEADAPLEPGGFLRMFRGGMSIPQIKDHFDISPQELTVEMNRSIHAASDAEWAGKPIHNGFVPRGTE